jgi:hypothetical protein
MSGSFLTDLFQVFGAAHNSTLVTEVVFKPLQVIAARTFSVLFLRLDTKHYVKWIVLIAQWSLISTIVIGGPATVRTDKHGPYCEKSFDLLFPTDFITAFQMALWEIGVG